jgi:N-acetylglutamate synthase-like GNAT family acetyltransferase
MPLTLHRYHPPEIKLLRTILQFPLTADNPTLTGWLALGTDTANQTQIMGAVALEGDERGGLVWVRVLPPYRRQGIGSRLLKMALDEANNRNIPELSTLPGITEEAGMKFAQAHGFNLSLEMEDFEVPLQQACDYFQEFYNWFEKRGSIPPNLQLRWDKEVAWGAGKRLLDPHFGYGVKRQVNRIIAQGMQPTDWALSITLNNDLVAIGVGYLKENRIVASAYAVAPAYRQGWAHIVAKYLYFTGLQQRYPERTIFGFAAGETFSDTLKWGKKMGATCVRRSQIYKRSIL